jgi:signal transduction histidine kinase
LYGLLVLLIVAIGVWWVIFLSYDGRRYEQYNRERIEADREAAAYVLRSAADTSATLLEDLRRVFPDLVFRETPAGVEAVVNPIAIEEVKREARRRKRMFTAEGIFFLSLLAAGATILTIAYRSEREFKRARELFLAGATHDLKTPLASLRLYTQTLDRHDIGEAEGARIRKRMIDDVQRLEALIEQILALGYDETAGNESDALLDLGEETERVLLELDHYLAANGASVERDLPAGHLVLASPFVLALLVRNLVVNAVSHSLSPAKVKVSLARRGRMLQLSVRDWGPGIPRRDRRKVFEGFVRLDEADGSGRKSPGTGLGLYLVKRQAEMMGGRVELLSEVGAGSTFTLMLPAHEGNRS